MQKLIAAAASAVILSGCSPTEDVSKETFKYAINNQLSQDCLMLKTRDSDFPVSVDVPQTEREKLISINSDRIAQYDALVEAGLLTVESNTKTIQSAFEDESSTISLNVYSLTDLGQKSFKEIPSNSNMAGDIKGLCAASYHVGKVLEFSEPTQSMGETISHVRYTLLATGIQDWAQNENVQNAFPTMASLLNTERRQSATLVLKEDGWFFHDDIK